MEKLLQGTGANSTSPQGVQQLKIGRFHITSEEDPRGADPCPSPPAGEPFMDLLQFAFQLNLGVNDTIILS